VSLARTGEEPLGPAKAAINGVPSLRLDAALPERAAARGFYTRLEDDIVPAFYHRDRRGVPVHWIGRVSETFRAAIPAVCARRALKRSVEGGKARADV
jgi:hypothetical protein